MSSQALAALRAYVCAPGQAGGANQAESTVRLNVEHVALKATRFAELRLDKHVRHLILGRWPIDNAFHLLVSLHSPRDPAVDASVFFRLPRGTRGERLRLLFNS